MPCRGLTECGYARSMRALLKLGQSISTVFRYVGLLAAIITALILKDPGVVTAAALALSR